MWQFNLDISSIHNDPLSILTAYKLISEKGWFPYLRHTEVAYQSNWSAMELSAHVSACQPLILHIRENLGKATAVKSIEIDWIDSYSNSGEVITAADFSRRDTIRALCDAWKVLLGPLAQWSR